MSHDVGYVMYSLQLASNSAMFVEGLHKNYFAKTLFRQLTSILVRYMAHDRHLMIGMMLYRRETLADIRRNVWTSFVPP